MTAKNHELPFQIGDFIVSPKEHTLSQQLADKPPKLHQLPAKSIEVLCYLVHHYPQMITRDQLINDLWPEKPSIGQKSLTNAIWTLRKILANDSQYPEMITTIRKSGYKFEVEPQFNTMTKSDPIPDKNEPQNLADTTETPASQTDLKRPQPAVILTLLIAALITIMALNWSEETPNITISNEAAINITKEPGREIYAASSPDNHWLAYIWYRLDHTSELRIQDTNNLSSRPITLLSSRERLLKPVWQQDSQSIFVIRKDKTKGTCDILEFQLDNQQLDVITSCSVDAHVFLSISADGNTLYYTDQPQDSRAAGRYSLELSKGASPKRESCLKGCKYKDRDIEFAPNGRLAVEVRKYTPHTEDLYLIDQQTQQTTRLTHDFEQFRGVRWMNDNIHLIVSASVHGQRQGFLINSQTRQKKAIDIEGFSYPSISRDGKQLYYHDWQQREFISSIQLDNSNTAPFPLLQSNYNYTEPHYNQARDQIVYVSNETGFTELWLADKNGNNRQQLTNNQAMIKFPRWSFNGQHIAFIEPQTGADKNLLKVIRVSTGVITTINSPYHLHRRPTWHIDNQHLISSVDLLDHHHQHSLKLFSIAQEQAPVELQQDGLHGEMQPNGDLIFSKENDGLWYFNAQQNQSVQLISQEQLGSPFNWTTNNNKIYFESAKIDRQLLNQFELNTGKISTLAHFPKRTIKTYGSMTYLPKDQQILLSQRELPRVDIKRKTMMRQKQRRR